jgi:uncharacterized membrane protein YuzA (DUF378 family)
MKKSILDWIALILVIVGAVNWGLVGIGSLMKSNLNVVNILLGSIPSLENIVYILVGLAGLYTIYYLVKD